MSGEGAISPHPAGQVQMDCTYLILLSARCQQVFWNLTLLNVKMIVPAPGNFHLIHLLDLSPVFYAGLLPPFKEIKNIWRSLSYRYVNKESMMCYIHPFLWSCSKILFITPNNCLRKIKCNMCGLGAYSYEKHQFNLEFHLWVAHNSTFFKSNILYLLECNPRFFP